MSTWILDTGPLVAYLNPRDAAHRLSVDRLNAFGGRLITTSAIITEAMHFLVDYAGGPPLLLEFLKTTGMEIVECCQPEDLQPAVELMTKYEDTPMDFADATLVLLAERRKEYRICTLDRRGFQTFRTAAGKRFSLVIDQSE